MAGGDDPFGIGDDPAVVEEQVDVIFGGEKRAHVALEHEVRLHRPLDRLDHFPVRSVDQVAQPATDRLLPVGKRVDVIVDTRVSLIARTRRTHLPALLRARVSNQRVRVAMAEPVL